MVSENLYVVKRTIFDPKNPQEPKFTVTLPAVFTDLPAAKEHAKNVLINGGYSQDDFTLYALNSGAETWPHGDGVILYAEAPPGEIFKVEVETVPNSLGLEAVESPKLTTPLHFVVQTVIDYDADRSGSKRYSVIEGMYLRREQAREQALKVLLSEEGDRAEFAEYNEYVDVEGPFGPDVVVHAVREGGMNILVSVFSK